ncbi:MAG: carboxylating nicotinate-nucleotide diphosphorylase [Pirellulales bacterium]|nr:carboxylating nicotinate-nucleotide diphosphorylase [Pirellulales bacterium]
MTWDDARASWQALLRLAGQEDLGETGDLTSRALIDETAIGHAVVVARAPGVLAGMPAAEQAVEYYDPRLVWLPEANDGDLLEPGRRIARIEGPARGLLAVERPLLNVLSRLSGIATLTRRFVDAVAGTPAVIYDTRKTTPGWRRLEKFAVRCGGGCNHRTGLFDAILIKDNHLALWGTGVEGMSYSLAQAVRRARQFIEIHMPEPQRPDVLVEIEVDTLTQLDEVLPSKPDVILLDNMTPSDLRQAIARRDVLSPETVLEASGGVDLNTVRSLAETGIDRISVGALTHSAVALDLGLDWLGLPG